MKRILLALALLVASCAPQLAYAQQRNAVGFQPWTIAVTFCQFTKDSVYGRTFVDEEALTDTALTAEVRVHEASHRADVKQDWVTYCAPKPRDLLRSEVKAYCAEAPLDVSHGDDPMLLWFSDLRVLLRQLEGAVPPDTIRRAWYDGCGKQLGVKAH